MPHGTPDWGLVGPLPTFFGLDDMAEQAVRLGAVSSWDRIGHVVFSDNFREGLGAWRRQGSDPTAVACLDTKSSMSAPFCVKLVNGSAGAFYARMNHYLGYEYRGHAALEFNAAIEMGTGYLKFGLFSALPTGRQFFYIRITVATGDAAYGSDVTGWTPFGNVGGVVSNIWEWHNVKVVANFGTGYYVKLVWEGATIDMRAIPCDTAGALIRDFWTVLIENIGLDSDQYRVWIDDVIVTVDEP